jgi:hypothetical protein
VLTVLELIGTVEVSGNASFTLMMFGGYAKRIFQKPLPDLSLKPATLKIVQHITSVFSVVTI